MGLDGQVAIITGGGRGIGRAYALRFADEGARVVVVDIIPENSQEVAKEIKDKGGEALALHIDVSREADTVEMAKKTVERFGRIDILINNAAVLHSLGFNSWDSWSPEDWDRIYAVNAIGSWLCTKAVVPYMIDQGKGKIINVSSDTTQFGSPSILPYTCSKGAVIVLTRSLANALGKYNINVNCISPGFTLTEVGMQLLDKTPELDEMSISARCLKRSEHPDDLVGTAVFLASKDSDFITGQNITVNGGQTMN